MSGGNTERQREPGKPKAPETPPHIPVSCPKVGNSQEDVRRVPANLKEGHTMFTETMTEQVKELRELKRMAEELAGEIAPAFLLPVGGP